MPSGIQAQRQRELAELAAELDSLAKAGGPAMREQADELAQRANRLGYPSLADAIDRAKRGRRWGEQAEGLRKAAELARGAVG